MDDVKDKVEGAVHKQITGSWRPRGRGYPEERRSAKGPQVTDALGRCRTPQLHRCNRQGRLFAAYRRVVARLSPWSNLGPDDELTVYREAIESERLVAELQPYEIVAIASSAPGSLATFSRDCQSSS